MSGKKTTKPSVTVTVTAADRAVNPDAQIAASSLIASVSDTGNNTITEYQFTDNGSGGGYFLLNGVKQAAGTVIKISAANLAQLVYVGGSAKGSETISIVAVDSKGYASQLASATVTTNAPVPPPVVSNTPAWCNNLSDAGVKADVVNAAADGVVTYNEMLKILQDVAGNGVTANEFNDLKAIMTNGSNGITMSSYVHDIANKLINGDAANAFWYGGATTKTALGNLASGSTATQMNELIQKWFLGGDLPNPTDTSGTVRTYAKSSAPLFGAGGPSVTDINQGRLGDCYLLASLADVACTEPSVLTSMFHDNGNATWGVRFYIGGKENWVTVDNSVATGFNSSTNIWGTLVEKAYAQLNSSGVLPRAADDSYKAIESGAADPITEITGRSVTYYNAASFTNNAWLNLATTFQNAVDSKLEVWVGSSANLTANGKSTFASSHAYSVIGFDKATGNFIVRNPWGKETATDNGSHWVASSYTGYWAVFEASMSDLFLDKANVAVAGAVASGLTPTQPTSNAVAGGIDLGQFGGSVALADSLGLGTSPGASALLAGLDQTKRDGLLAASA